MSNLSLIALGERIRETRKRKGWTQEELAEHAAIDRSYLGGVERGERNVTFTMLVAITSALETDVSELTRGLGRGGSM